MGNLNKTFTLEHPENIQRLRSILSSGSDFSDLEVEALWKEFSRLHRSDYLFPSEKCLTEFKDWLES